MNNAYTMSASLEAKHRSQASMITAGFAGLMILIMFLLKWKLPVFEKNIDPPGIEVELNLPPEPEIPANDGGGGGGNPVQAAGPAGIAEAVPPTPGEKDDSKDVEENNDKESPEVIKPPVVKPDAKKITNTSIAKTEPKPIVETPAPPRPKAVLGKTTTGTGQGGGAADDYDRAGGRGNGSGVGNGNGTGGGSGVGNGGGNGNGTGGGSGIKKISGNRSVINPSPMDAGENINGKVKALIRVSPDGVGKFMQTTAGSLQNDSRAKDIIREWLRRNRFNKSSEESIVEYEFTIIMGG